MLIYTIPFVLLALVSGMIGYIAGAVWQKERIMGYVRWLNSKQNLTESCRIACIKDFIEKQ